MDHMRIRVLNPHQWSLAKEDLKICKVMPKSAKRIEANRDGVITCYMYLQNYNFNRFSDYGAEWHCWMF